MVTVSAAKVAAAATSQPKNSCSVNDTSKQLPELASISSSSSSSSSSSPALRGIVVHSVGSVDSDITASSATSSSLPVSIAASSAPMTSVTVPEEDEDEGFNEDNTNTTTNTNTNTSHNSSSNRGENRNIATDSAASKLCGQLENHQHSSSSSHDNKVSINVNDNRARLAQSKGQPERQDQHHFYHHHHHHHLLEPGTHRHYFHHHHHHHHHYLPTVHRQINQIITERQQASPSQVHHRQQSALLISKDGSMATISAKVPAPPLPPSQPGPTSQSNPESTSHQSSQKHTSPDINENDNAEQSLPVGLILHGPSGSVRGKRNIVRNSIQNYKQMVEQANLEKGKRQRDFRKEEQHKCVLYVTTLGVIRKTFDESKRVKAILKNNFIEFDERDVFINEDFKRELRQRLGSPDLQLQVPLLFVCGQVLGGFTEIEKLNETGQLVQKLNRFRSQYQAVPNSTTEAVTVQQHHSHKVPTQRVECSRCGGTKFVNCEKCNGSCKTYVHHFNYATVNLKCSHCRKTGLVRCPQC